MFFTAHCRGGSRTESVASVASKIAAVLAQSSVAADYLEISDFWPSIGIVDLAIACPPASPGNFEVSERGHERRGKRGTPYYRSSSADH